MLLKVCENVVLSVKKLGSGWDVELLGASSESQLFAYSTSVVIGRLRVNNNFL